MRWRAETGRATPGPIHDRLCRTPLPPHLGSGRKRVVATPAAPCPGPLASGSGPIGRRRVPTEVAPGLLSRPDEAFACRSVAWSAARSSSSGPGAASEVVVIEMAFHQQPAGSGAVAGPGTRTSARVPPTTHTTPLVRGLTPPVVRPLDQRVVPPDSPQSKTLSSRYVRDRHHTPSGPAHPIADARCGARGRAVRCGAVRWGAARMHTVRCGSTDGEVFPGRAGSARRRGQLVGVWARRGGGRAAACRRACLPRRGRPERSGRALR